MNIRSFGTQKEQTVVDMSTRRANPILHYSVEYDSTRPEETIRNFVADIRGMIAKYEYNKNRIAEIETELVDLEHYIEIASYKTVPNGYKLYRKMAELRRERRACKNENDLLWPVYEYFHATEVLNRLSTLQGDVAKVKGAVDSRSYLVRTDILEEYMNPPKKEGPEDEDPMELVADGELVLAEVQ